MTTRLLLIRHGQTEWNHEGRWQGTIDTPLSALGLAQAETLAAHLADNEPLLSHVYTSPLQRAAITAEVIARRLNVPTHHDDRLKELDLGAFQGLTLPEMTERFPDVVEEMHKGELDFGYPQGETRRQLYDRAFAAITDIAQLHPGAAVAIVTHGGVKRMVVRRILGDESYSTIPSFGNTSVTVLEADPSLPSGWRLTLAASTAHLNDESRTDSTSL